MLGIRQKTLDYPTFALSKLRGLLFPDPDNVNLDYLVDAFNKHVGKSKLNLLQQASNDPVRHEFDDAVAKTLGIENQSIQRMRMLIGNEPSLMKAKDYDVHNEG